MATGFDVPRNDGHLDELYDLLSQIEPGVNYACRRLMDEAHTHTFEWTVVTHCEPRSSSDDGARLILIHFKVFPQEDRHRK